MLTTYLVDSSNMKFFFQISFPEANLDHLAHHCILWSADFVVAHFGPGLQHQVNCDFCTALLLCQLLISLLFEVFDPFFMYILRLFRAYPFIAPLHFFLPFFSMFSEMLVDVSLRKKLFKNLLLTNRQTALHQVLRSGFSNLFLEYSSFDELHTSRSRFLTRSHIIWCSSFSVNVSPSQLLYNASHHRQQLLRAHYSPRFSSQIQFLGFTVLGAHPHPFFFLFLANCSASLPSSILT